MGKEQFLSDVPERVAEQLKNIDPKDAQSAKEIVSTALLEAVGRPLDFDYVLYRMVVGSLGLTVLLCAIGSIMLALGGRDTPEVLVALGSAAVGALAGLLAPSPVDR